MQILVQSSGEWLEGWLRSGLLGVFGSDGRNRTISTIIQEPVALPLRSRVDTKRAIAVMSKDVRDFAASPCDRKGRARVLAHSPRPPTPIHFHLLVTKFGALERLLGFRVIAD